MSDPVLNVWARGFLIVFGGFCIVGGFHRDTTIGGFGGSNHRPISRAQRVILVVFGCLFALCGLMGWVH